MSTKTFFYWNDKKYNGPTQWARRLQKKHIKARIAMIHAIHCRNTQ